MLPSSQNYSQVNVKHLDNVSKNLPPKKIQSFLKKDPSEIKNNETKKRKSELTKPIVKEIISAKDLPPKFQTKFLQMCYLLGLNNIQQELLKVNEFFESKKKKTKRKSAFKEGRRYSHTSSKPRAK